MGYREFDWTDCVNNIKKGDESAFAYFYEKTYADMKKQALMRTGFKDKDAEDIVEDVYLTVYQGIGGLKDPNALTAWMQEVCDARCKEYVSENMEDTDIPESVPGDEDDLRFKLPDAVDVPTDPEVVRRLLGEITGSMSPAERMCIDLQLSGRSEEETAEITGLTEGQVRACLKSAKNIVKEKAETLEAEGNDLGGMEAVPFYCLLVRLFSSDSLDAPKDPEGKAAEVFSEAALLSQIAPVQEMPIYTAPLREVPSETVAEDPDLSEEDKYKESEALRNEPEGTFDAASAKQNMQGKEESVSKKLAAARTAAGRTSSAKSKKAARRRRQKAALVFIIIAAVLILAGAVTAAILLTRNNNNNNNTPDLPAESQSIEAESTDETESTKVEKETQKETPSSSQDDNKETQGGNADPAYSDNDQQYSGDGQDLVPGQGGYDDHYEGNEDQNTGGNNGSSDDWYPEDNGENDWQDTDVSISEDSRASYSQMIISRAQDAQNAGNAVSLTDITGNGVPEMFISGVKEYPGGAVNYTEIYTIDGDSLKRLGFDTAESDGGRIVNGSSSAVPDADSYDIYFRTSDSDNLFAWSYNPVTGKEDIYEFRVNDGEFSVISHMQVINGADPDNAQYILDGERISRDEFNSWKQDLVSGIEEYIFYPESAYDPDDPDVFDRTSSYVKAMADIMMYAPVSPLSGADKETVNQAFADTLSEHTHADNVNVVYGSDELPPLMFFTEGGLTRVYTVYNGETYEVTDDLAGASVASDADMFRTSGEPGTLWIHYKKNGSDLLSKYVFEDGHFTEIQKVTDKSAIDAICGYAIYQYAPFGFRQDEMAEILGAQ